MDVVKDTFDIVRVRSSGEVTEELTVLVATKETILDPNCRIPLTTLLCYATKLVPDKTANSVVLVAVILVS